MKEDSAGSIALVSLFITALITSQVVASKLIGIEIPFSLPIVGTSLVLPGSGPAYALTFFASDCYTELYGKERARRMVNVGFLMNLVMLAIIWSTILAPAVDSQQNPGAFGRVLGQSTNIIFASLIAYVVSQNWDVLVFHKIGEMTDGRHLWLRNIGSTATSQAIDTVIFISVGFYVAPMLLGGTKESLSIVAALVVSQYLLKLVIAVVDTPLVYGVVDVLGSEEERRRSVPNS